MTPATVRVSKPAKRATPWSSWTTTSPVRSSVKERSAPRRGPPSSPPTPPPRSARRRRSSRCSGKTASFSEGATKPSRSEAAAKRRDASNGAGAHVHPGSAGVGQPGGVQAREVVRRPLPLPAAGKRDHGAVARAHQLLQLRLRLRQRARGDVRGLCAQLQLLAARQRGEPDAHTRLQRRADLLGAHVQVVCVGVVERRAHVAPVVLQRRGELLLRGHQQLGVRAQQVQQRPEALHRQELRDVRALRGVLEGRDLSEFAVLGRQLRRRRNLDLHHVPQRALGERGEPAQRLDLHVEHVHPHRALLGRGEDVKDLPAHRELPALLHLVDTLVPRRHELVRALVQVQQLPRAQRERARAQRRVGNLLRERHRGDDHHGGLGFDAWGQSRRGAVSPHGRPSRREQRVERSHPQPNQVRRRG